MASQEKIISPGVFTKEIDQTFLPAAVGAIGACLIGPTLKGPAMVPTVINSYGEFQQMFGDKFKSGSSYYQYFTSHTAKEYLRNGGSMTVVRTLGGDYGPATATINSTSPAGTTVGAITANTAITIGTVPHPSASSQLRIGGVDFMAVLSASDFDNTRGGERYVSAPGGLSGSARTATELDLFGNLLAGTINSASADGIVSVDATYNTSTNKLILSASTAGTAGNITVISSSNYETTQVYVAAKAGADGNPSLTGGTDSVTSAESEGDATLVLETIADGRIMNSTGSIGENSILTAVDPTSPSASVGGNKDNVRWEISDKNNSKGTFTLLIRRGDDSHKRKQTLETWSNLSLDPNEPNYVEKVIGNTKNNFATDSDGNKYIQPSGSYPNKSKYVRVSALHKQTPEYLDENGNLSSNAFSASLPLVGSGSFGGSFSGGSNGTMVDNGGSSGTAAKFYDETSEANWQGFNLGDGQDVNTAFTDALSLVNNQDEYDVNLILIPGIIDGQIGANIVSKAIDVCEDRGDTFTVFDVSKKGDAITTATAQAESRDTNYAAVYYPWVQIADAEVGTNRWVPPSILIPGVFAFNDRIAHPWFAPAGLNRGGIDSAIQAERKLTHANRDTLYDSNVNPIATFPGQGVTVFGQKTLQKKASALDRVNVRRLMITVKKFIASSSRFLVFEQNTSATRQRFLNIVNPYLERVQQQSGLNAFRVVMDTSNNTPDVIDRNQLVGQLFLQPTRTAEFVVLDFTILPTGATFPE